MWRLPWAAHNVRHGSIRCNQGQHAQCCPKSALDSIRAGSPDLKNFLAAPKPYRVAGIVSHNRPQPGAAVPGSVTHRT